MAEVKKEKNIEKIEREYVIPLREKCRVVPRYKKANKAIKTIKEFLVRHMKLYDQDLKKIKIDKYLNEVIWARGIRKPPIKVRVKAIREGDTVKVEAMELSKKLGFKKARENKIEEKAKESLKKKKEKTAEKIVEEKPLEEKPEEDKNKVEKKKSESEKIKASGEETKNIEKAAAKQIKHQIGGKTKQPKRPQRKSLAK